MKLSLPNAVTTRFARQVLVTQKHSPQILFYGGLVLMAGTVVTACKGTLELEDVLEDIKRDRADVVDVVRTHPERYSEKQTAKLNVYITMKGLARIGKLYLPAVALGVAAVACLTSSHNQLTRRNAGLSAALAATERALNSYRDRVRDELGDDRELKLWRGERTEKVAQRDKDGNPTDKKTTIKTGGGYSPYARVWGRDTSTEWSPQPEYNLAKLRIVQEYLTLLLNSRGHVFLNDAFDELGLDRTPAGSQVGWMSEKYGGVDGYIDFGVLAPGEEIKFLDFVTGREEHVMLDFNVDGEIWRKI